MRAQARAGTTHKGMWRVTSGGVVIVVALMLPLLLAVLGVTVDVGRLYAVQSRVQNAADAAILGAVATASSTNVARETKRLFNANFPADYMGSTVKTIHVSRPSRGEYLLRVSVKVPTSVMQVFGSRNATITTTSRVAAGYQLGRRQKLELALVFDNSQISDTASMAAAGKAMIDTLFGGEGRLPNVHVSVVPFDTAVDVGNNRVSWIQPSFVGRYNQYRMLAGGKKGFIANRNNDAPPNALVDVTDSAPNTNETRFRVPFAYGPGPPFNSTNNPDYVSTSKLAGMQFGLNEKADILDALGKMRPTAGNRRINVGLMWGWFALSPNWQGRFSPGLPGLPANDNPLDSKQLVLVVTGKNNVYIGTPTSNDDTTTRQLCQAVQSKGIRVYTVGFGAAGSYDATLLQACATGSSFFFPAVSSAQLTAAFQTIADDIQYSTIRLMQ